MKNTNHTWQPLPSNLAKVQTDVYFEIIAKQLYFCDDVRCHTRCQSDMDIVHYTCLSSSQSVITNLIGKKFHNKQIWSQNLENGCYSCEKIRDFSHTSQTEFRTEEKVMKKLWWKLFGCTSQIHPVSFFYKVERHLPLQLINAKRHVFCFRFNHNVMCWLCVIGGDIDYHSGPYHVMFPAGMIRVRFIVLINDDSLLEENETFTLTIKSSLPRRVLAKSDQAQAKVTIVDTECEYYMMLLMY